MGISRTCQNFQHFRHCATRLRNFEDSKVEKLLQPESLDVWIVIHRVYFAGH